MTQGKHWRKLQFHITENGFNFQRNDLPDKQLPRKNEFCAVTTAGKYNFKN